QGPRLLHLAMQGIRDQSADVAHAKRGQHNFVHFRVCFVDCIQPAQQWMSVADLVLPVRSDQQQIPHFKMCQQVLEEIQCCCVQPLQIIEKEYERMLFLCEYAEKSPKDQLEATLRVSAEAQ